MMLVSKGRREARAPNEVVGLLVDEPVDLVRIPTADGDTATLSLRYLSLVTFDDLPISS